MIDTLNNRGNAIALMASIVAAGVEANPDQVFSNAYTAAAHSINVAEEIIKALEARSDFRKDDGGN